MPGFEACLHHHSCYHDRDGVHSSAVDTSGFTLPGARREYAPDLRIEPIHLDVSLRFNLHATDADERLRVQAEVVTKVKCNSEGAHELILNGVSFKDVTVNDEGVAHYYDGDRLTLHWKKPYALHEQRTVTVQYVIDRPVSGMFLCVPDSGYSNRPAYCVTDEESERARYWLLCVDYPAVRTQLTFHLTAHESFSTVANGLLQGTEALPGNLKKWTWHCEHLVPSYLICLGVAAWDIVKATAPSPVPIEYYALSGCGTAAARAFDPTPQVMNWMVARLGVPFPFKAYRILTSPGIGGAMENITLTTFDQRFLVDAKSAEEWQDTVTDVNVHEMAHSYFGDAVVVRHFEHAWLKESWANYMETLYIDFEYDLWNSSFRYFSECERYMRPIVTRMYNNSFQLYDMHLYPGGAWRLHMLRNRLGDTQFFAAVKHYITQKTVETDDFRKILEAYSGQNLTRYFDEFFYAPNYPRLSAAVNYSLENGQLRILVQQNRPQGEEPYEISLEVAVTDRNGQKHEGKLSWSSHKEAFVCFTLSAPPTVIEFDPHTKLLFSMEWNPGEDILAATAERAGSIGARIGAIATLIRKGSPTAIDSALRIALKEPYWGALASLLRSETNPLALHNIASLCGIRDTSLEEALISVLDRPNLPYRANARALEALGAQRNPATLSRLLAAANDNGWQGIVRLGALQGLSKLGQAEAMAVLAARVPYGGETQEMIRADVISAYGAYIANFGDARDVKRATELLLDALRSHGGSCLGRYSVNALIFAIRALVALRATHTTAAIASVKAGIAYQYHVLVEAELIILRKATDDTVSQLTKRVAELESRIRTLEEKKGN